MDLTEGGAVELELRSPVVTDVDLERVRRAGLQSQGDRVRVGRAGDRQRSVRHRGLDGRGAQAAPKAASPTVSTPPPPKKRLMFIFTLLSSTTPPELGGRLHTSTGAARRRFVGSQRAVDPENYRERTLPVRTTLPDEA